MGRGGVGEEGGEGWGGVGRGGSCQHVEHALQQIRYGEREK